MGAEPALADLEKIILDGLRAKGYEISEDTQVIFCNVTEGDEIG